MGLYVKNVDGVLTYFNDGVEVEREAAITAFTETPEGAAVAAKAALVENARALRDGMFSFIVNVPVENRDPATVSAVEQQANDLLEASIGVDSQELTALVSEITALSLRGTRERLAYEASLNT